MKTLINATLTLSVIACLHSCKQNNVIPNPNAGAINITNAVIGGSTLDFTTGGATNLTSANTTVSSNGYSFLPVAGGQQQITLNIPAVPASPGVPATPAVTYFSGSLFFNANSNYSLFLAGPSPAAVDDVLIKENYTRTYADSVFGVRFINLAPGSNPISVDIRGNANGSEVASLAYKAYSAFNQHPAQAVNTSYVFEFRDAATGNLITTYTLNTPFFHNVTLALRGTVGGSVGVILDKDF
jgi:hypothetical protein